MNCCRKTRRARIAERMGNKVVIILKCLFLDSDDNNFIEVCDEIIRT